MEVIIRVGKAVFGVTVFLGGVLILTTPAFGQSSTGGPIKVWGVANSTSGNKPSPVVITGAIGDYGTTFSVNSSGKPDGNGNYTKLSLKKGTFTVSTSQLNSAFNSAFSSANPSDFNSTSCSASLAVGPVPVPIKGGSGTGAYQGISGSVTLSANIAFILPKTKKGSCNMSNNANPIASWGEITGPGTVSFG